MVLEQSCATKGAHPTGVLKQRHEVQKPKKWMSEYKLRLFSEFEINSAFGSEGQTIILISDWVIKDEKFMWSL